LKWIQVRWFIDVNCVDDWVGNWVGNWVDDWVGWSDHNSSFYRATLDRFPGGV